MNGYTLNSNHSSIALPLYLYTLTDHVLTILVANVYVDSLEKWLLRQLLLLCYKKLKNVKFTKRLQATTKGFQFCQF